MQVCSKGKEKGGGPIFPACLQILPLEFLPKSKPHKARVKFTVCSSVTALPEQGPYVAHTSWGVCRRGGGGRRGRVMVNLQATINSIVCQNEYSREKQESGFPDFVVAFQYLKEAYKKDGDELLGRAYYDRRRDLKLKLKEDRFR